MVAATITVRELKPASADFPASEWTCLERVPVFKEHTADDGTVYGRDELASIVENCNRRIRATGDYCPLVDGHTPSPEEESAGAKQPDVLGFAGPFYLERSLEDGRPVWVITADWHVRLIHLERVRSLPRRSVEIWKLANVHDRYFDPIALLGAKTPRLDLGLAYSRTRAEQTVLVERYEAGFASATNAFIPAATAPDRRPSTTEKERMALDDSDLQKIVAALDQLDWVQWVKTQMTCAAAPDPGDNPAAPAGAEPNAMHEGKIEPEGDPPATGSVEKNARAGQPDKYEKIAKELAGRVAELEAKNVAVTRNAKIDALRETYAFDAAKVKQRAAKMTDDQFNDWVADASEHYQRIPAGESLGLQTPTPGRITPAFTAADRNRAVDLAAAKNIGYAQAMAEIKGAK